MARKFQHKRGVKANLPKLSPAEMAFTTDEKKLYVGDGNENIRLLDQKDKTELTTQLAETAKHTENVRIKGVDITGYGKKSKVLVSFVSDDGQSTDITILKPIFDAEGVPCCSAVTTGITNKPHFDKPMSKEQLLLLQSSEWEIIGHTHNHPALGSDGLSEAEIEQQFITNNRILREMGCEVNNLMYPHGSSNATVQRIARKYYRSAFTFGNGAIDVPPFDTFNIRRVSLGAWFDQFVDNPTKYPAGTRNTFETYYKKRVDEAIEKGGWLVFGLHSNAPEFDATQQRYLRETIQYIKSLGIPIVTINEGLDIVGNVIDVKGYNNDDSTARHFTVGSDGKISTSEIKELDAIDVVLPNNAVNLDSPLSAFEMGKITYCFTNTGAPIVQGMLTTHYKYDDWAWQTLQRKDGTIQTRSIVHPAMTWSTWQTILVAEKMGQKKNWYRTNVTVNANSTLDHIVTGFRVPDSSQIVVGSPFGGLPSGVSYYIYVGNEATPIDNVHIKLINHTASNVAVNVEWLLRSLQY